MKVVLFCGGLGMRLRPLSSDGSTQAGGPEDVPKPMVHIGGQRPLIWHVMKYYAHYGHKDFILCLGYRPEVIKDFFLSYNECMSNDFVLTDGGANVQLLHNDIKDWRITFVDTGLKSCVGERLKAVEKYLEGEEMFLANYSDGLTDLPLDKYLDWFCASDKTGAFVSVLPPQTSHVVQADASGVVSGIRHIREADVRINGGYFAFRKDIFKYMQRGEELVQEPFARLIKEQKLLAYRFDGFWMCMDTFKEKMQLDEMCAADNTPWQVWRKPAER